MKVDFVLCEKCCSELAYWSAILCHQAIRDANVWLCESCVCDLIQDIALGDSMPSLTVVSLLRL